MSRGKFYTPEFKEQAVKRVIEGSEQISKVARELGVNDKTLGGWVSAYRRKNAGRPLPVDMPEQDRVRELERRNRELEAEVAFLKKLPRTSRRSSGEREVLVHRCGVRDCHCGQRG